MSLSYAMSLAQLQTAPLRFVTLQIKTRIKHVTAAGPSEGDTVLLYMCKKTTEEQKCHKTQVHYLTLGNAHTLTRYMYRTLTRYVTHTRYIVYSYLEQPLGSDGELGGGRGGGGRRLGGGEHCVTRAADARLAPLLPRQWVPAVRALAAEHLQPGRQGY